MENFYFSLAAGSQFKTAKELQYPYVLINFMSQTNYPPKHPYKNLFVDSGAWDYEARWKKFRGDLCSSEASTVCAVNYIKKIDNLKLKNKSQQKLMEKYDYKQNKGDEKHE